MKAKTVQFERGKDPKEVMGVGIHDRIKDMMLKDGWKYDGIHSVLKWAAAMEHPEFVKWAVMNGAREWLDKHPGDFAMQAIAEWQKPDPELLDFLANNGANMYIIGYFTIKDKFYHQNPEMMKVIRKHYPGVDDDIKPWLNR